MYIDVNKYKDMDCDSHMIQAAVDEAVKTGAEVIIPQYNLRTGEKIWNITETINLYDGSCVLIHNAHLKLADDVNCNIFKNSNCATEKGLTKEGRQSHITIRGVGHALLDGGKYHNICERTPKEYNHPPMYNSHSIHFQNVEHAVIENLYFTNHRYWAICLRGSAYSRISNIFFSSTGNVPNQDGIDLRVGCHDIIIENITGYTGDDFIALTGIFHDSDEFLHPVDQPKEIHDVIIRNIMGYGVCGCSLIRLLNNDGIKLYNITIDTVHETSQWSWEDAQVAVNPDLFGVITDDGHFKADYYPVGEVGYRLDTLIRLGENFWFDPEKGPAKPGDTYGITIKNISTHACSALTVSCTLQDSIIENVKIFGNGSRAVLCNDGNLKNVTFKDIYYTVDSMPHPEDEHIHMSFNATDADGFSAVYFNRTDVSDVYFNNIVTGKGISAVFDGTGKGTLDVGYVRCMNKDTLVCASESIKINKV